MRRTLFTGLLSAFSFASTFAAAATPQTFLTLMSQPGDYIGQGITQTFTPADGTFILSNSSDTASITFHNSDYSQFWTLYFGTPTTVKFGRGEFDKATRTAFRSPTSPGIDVGGDGRGCNTDTGRFLVSDFALNADGTIARLAIDFEQHCESITPALFGSFRYNSTVTAVPRLGIAGTYALKGNAGTSDASVTVALCLPSSGTVQVNYTTINGTGVEGTDYISSNGNVTFQPGVTAQTITIPIVGDVLARGNKIFKVQLSTASGAPITVASANVLIRDPNIAQTVLAMSSQPGDYIGQGLQYLITLSDANFLLLSAPSPNQVTFEVNNGQGWAADFAGPNSGVRLGKGDYENAQRYPFQPAGTPGLSIYGDGRGCNTLTGNFQVLQAGYNTSNVLQSFSANFEQHCEGGTPALFGWLRYHTKLQQFSVTDAVISGSNATFTVTLNPASATPTSVAFATSDGTAVGGTDYTTVAQTVSFSPGITQQTVTVPLLNPSATGKTFYGQLSAPSGAAVWVGQGSATF